ncbi:MAG: alpha-amylase [Deltaproteobacteria bacterium]|nr:alpha-amylase [Deltaproteobacteria bacterium]
MAPHAGEAPWWRRAVIYQIYPRSFADGNGDGVGDLKGLCDRLDHLSWLGVDALWLSPFYRSPMRDFGYDVSDYCDVDPVFGTLADFDALVAAAHARDLRVVVDWVPGHTSSDHAWFVEARSSRSSPKRDWYVWRDPRPDGKPPNNWVSAFTSGGPAWTFDEHTGQWWLHSFLPEQPDLNWENPEVQEAMLAVVRFWLDRGVDGFRVDVVHNIGKDPALADAEEKYAALPHCVLNDDPRTHGHLRRIRRVLDSYSGDRMMVGEVFLLTTEQIRPYYGDGDELHLSFNFPPMFAPWSAEKWRACIEEASALLDPIEAWPTWVLSNHDQPRHRTRYGGEARARAAAVLLLTLRGTPFLYMGEELGLENAVIPAERVVDPGGRDGCRAPLPWIREAGHGWPSDPWLPFPPDAAERSVEASIADPGSMLHLYRRILHARRASRALRDGALELLSSPRGLLAYRRVAAEDARVILVNTAEASASIELPSALVVDVASDGVGEGGRFEGIVAASRALILRPV